MILNLYSLFMPEKKKNHRKPKHHPTINITNEGPLPVGDTGLILTIFHHNPSEHASNISQIDRLATNPDGRSEQVGHELSLSFQEEAATDEKKSCIFDRRSISMDAPPVENLEIEDIIVEGESQQTRRNSASSGSSQK